MLDRRLSSLLAFLAFAGVGSAAEAPQFGRHVTPLLYKLGCSAGNCHGAFAGRGGFRLSLFAGDPEADYQNARGPLDRRVDPAKSERSLLLLKPTAQLPHGGGRRLATDSPEYRLLRDWIAAGARFASDEPRVLSVRVNPAAIVVQSEKNAALRAFAKLSNGIDDEVTRFVRFESLDPSIATVSTDGQVTGIRAGAIPVLAHYAGQIGFSNVMVPGVVRDGLTFKDEILADAVDRLISARLKKLNIVPAPVCTDEEFLRRVYLDTIGMLPLPEEIRAFLADKAADKRTRLIDRLLVHPLHAATWAGRMCDIIGADDRFIADGVYQFHDWFRNKFENNVPWDRIAFGVICATGADGQSAEQILAAQKRQAEEARKKKDGKAAKTAPSSPPQKPWQSGYAARQTLDVFYNNLINRQEKNGSIVDSRKIALRVAHTFLGVRLECAQCHKHPYDRWSQADFLSFATVFAHVEFGADPRLKAQKVNFAGTHASDKPVETFTDPVTGSLLGPRILGGPDMRVKPGSDVREEVWKWLIRPDNPFFAQAMVNRVWAHYLGRGLIEPADALAAANPPSHPEVLAELVRDFIQHQYDIRGLERRILNSASYQRSWKANAGNSHDERNYSRRLLRRLSAEQALDAIAQVTDTPIVLPKRYASVRPGVRAAEVAVSRVGGDDGYVLQVFGKPLRTQNCDCERSTAASLSQTLYLYNDSKLLAKIAAPRGRLAKLIGELKDDRQLLAELFLLTLTRYPTSAEVDQCLTYLRGARSRSEAYQDVLWSLMNRDEFIINH